MQFVTMDTTTVQKNWKNDFLVVLLYVLSIRKITYLSVKNGIYRQQ